MDSGPSQTIDLQTDVTRITPEAAATLSDEELDWALRIARKLTGSER
jgi:hypothetical protein